MVEILEGRPLQTDVVARLCNELPHAWEQTVIATIEREYGAEKTASMLNADWSTEWKVGRELVDELMGAVARGVFLAIAPTRTAQCLRQFLRLADQNKDVEAMTEQERLVQLNEQFGLVRGSGLAPRHDPWLGQR